jgi:hypothetical protein
MTRSDDATTSVLYLTALGGALGQRVRDIAAAVRRLDGIAAGGADVTASQPIREDTREFVLRMLRTASDRENDLILRALAGGATDGGIDLTEVTGRPRLALWEAIGDLVQVGLLERDPVNSSARLTPAGGAMLAMVDLLVNSAEEP